MKKIIVICMLLGFVLVGCTVTMKKETKKLKWVVFDLNVEMGAYQKSLNETLEKRGFLMR